MIRFPQRFSVSATRKRELKTWLKTARLFAILRSRKTIKYSRGGELGPEWRVRRRPRPPGKMVESDK